MFERTIYNVVQAGIDRLTAGHNGTQTLLKLNLASPGMTDAEVDTMVTFWNSDQGKPHIIHQFARKGAQLPLYSIVLAAENQDQFYLGDFGLDRIRDDCPIDLDELSDQLGVTVELEIQRWRFVYNIITYAENPDVCIGYHRVLRTIMLRAKKVLLEDGAEEPEISGTDLVADPRYLADNIFTRQLTVSVKAHVVYPTNIDLGPLALARGTKVAGIHVADNVTGVDPLLVPYTEDEE
jgi:hypothetical protein